LEAIVGSCRLTIVYAELRMRKKAIVASELIHRGNIKSLHLFRLLDYGEKENSSFIPSS
jgi:hypothetical protein